MIRNLMFRNHILFICFQHTTVQTAQEDKGPIMCQRQLLNLSFLIFSISPQVEIISTSQSVCPVVTLRRATVFVSPSMGWNVLTLPHFAFGIERYSEKTKNVSQRPYDHLFNYCSFTSSGSVVNLEHCLRIRTKYPFSFYSFLNRYAQ